MSSLCLGGIGYSQKYNPWTWLTSASAAEAMAAEVAKWPSLYGCDGIDLDIENGAGENQVRCDLSWLFTGQIYIFIFKPLSKKILTTTIFI